MNTRAFSVSPFCAATASCWITGSFSSAANRRLSQYSTTVKPTSTPSASVTDTATWRSDSVSVLAFANR